MSHNLTSSQLRSRKSRMVPRVTVNHEGKEHQLGKSTAMEQEDRNLQVTFSMDDGGDHAHTKTFLGHRDNTSHSETGHRDSALPSGHGESATLVVHSQRVTEVADHNPVPASSQDPLTWRNGQIAETSLSTEAVLHNDAEADDSDSDDSDNDGLGSSDRQPLLSGGEGGGGRIVDGVEIENQVVGEVIVQQAEGQESSLAIMLQVLLPYLIAGFGMVGAGMVLDVVQHSAVFTSVSELFILVPALLGLKGNLEMTLASRLSTQANLGNMDQPKERFKMIGGNMALIQAQATVVGFLASMFAMVMGWIPKGEFPVEHALLLCASSLFTAAVASFFLGSLMVGVVLLSRKLKVNPDNVATPIAASLGDLITLSLLAGVGSLLYSAIGKQEWLSPVIMAVFFALLPLWVILSVKNKYTNDVIYSGWVPVLSAMVISSLGGGILDFAVSKYHGIAVFQPVINGVGGNLVAVQASRISTFLHRRGRPGQASPGMTKGCANPFTFFCGKGINARAARVLLLLVVPGHLIFIYTIYYMKAGHTSITLLFNLFYLMAALLQVVVLLYVSQWMVHYIWCLGEDPDNIAIPYLTALGDLLGTAFLAMAFHALYLIGDRDADLGE